MTRGDWRRVSRRRPCPACGKPDWCLYAGPEDLPTAAICARVESPKRAGEAGWIHLLRDDGPVWAPWRRTIRTAIRMATDARGGPDLAAIAARWRLPADSPQLAGLGDALGLTPLALHRLQTGWSAERRAWSFPMRDSTGCVVGIRLRLPEGRKLSVKGGREGLFLPEGLDGGDRLLVCEGPTDTAALLDLGFPAVGRPNCTGGVCHVVDLVRRLAVPEVVIVADAAAPGQRGAERLAALLVAYCPVIRVITPPAGMKDAREWKRHGATGADVQSAIDAAPLRRLSVTVRRKAR